MASACIDREVIKYGWLQDVLVEWHNKCFDSKFISTLPDTNVIDLDTFSNELKYKNTSLSYAYLTFISVDNIINLLIEL